jgi:hypothetical protein
MFIPLKYIYIFQWHDNIMRRLQGSNVNYPDNLPVEKQSV